MYDLGYVFSRAPCRSPIPLPRIIVTVGRQASMCTCTIYLPGLVSFLLHSSFLSSFLIPSPLFFSDFHLHRRRHITRRFLYASHSPPHRERSGLVSAFGYPYSSGSVLDSVSAHTTQPHPPSPSPSHLVLFWPVADIRISISTTYTQHTVCVPVRPPVSVSDRVRVRVRVCLAP